MENIGNDFLNEKYPDLNKSKEVKSATDRFKKRDGEILRNKNEGINIYLNRIEEIFHETNTPKEKTVKNRLMEIFRKPEGQEKQTLHGDPIREQRIKIFKEKLHDLFVIKPEDITESFFDLQKKIAYEQGQGDMGISEEVKKQLADIAIRDQAQSLDNWIDYLSSKDAMYPTWFKYYTFRNVVKLASYDKEKKEFRNRSKGTTSLFPNINREALAYVYDSLEKSYVKKERLDNKEWQILLDRSNFGVMYAYAIERITPASHEQKEVTAGEWIKYKQNSDPKPLWQSLQGHGTGWCTAGEETAKAQLKLGDFYVFYSTDQKGKNIIPRIAIRMERENIAEIRGINPNQELESNIIDIADEKMKGLGGADKYKKKITDMKLLTTIEKRINNGEELTKDDLRFLYEIDSKIDGFGHVKDPRIWKILKERHQKKDYALIFDCLPENVITGGNYDAVDDNTVVLTEHWNWQLHKIPKNLKYYIGNFSLKYNKEITDLGNLEYISGTADFGSEIKNLGNLQAIGGWAWFEGAVTDLGKLKKIGGGARFEYGEITNLGNLEIIGGNVYFENSNVRNLGKLKTIDGDIFIDKGSRLNFRSINHGKVIRGR